MYDPQERARIRKEWAIEYTAYTRNITRLISENNSMKKGMGR
jgi:hypothetical protein